MSHHGCQWLFIRFLLCSISYEPSYLPFLFPGLSSTSKNTILVADVNTEPDGSHEGDDSWDGSEVINYKGRRKFGKHGKEATEASNHTCCPAKPVLIRGSFQDTLMPAPPPPIPQTVLPRGFKSISSHGRAAAGSSQPKSSHRPPQRSQRAMTPPPPPTFNSQVSPPKIQGFMKPQVDAPRAREDNGAQKKRTAEGVSELSNGNPTDETDSGKRKKKRRKE